MDLNHRDDRITINEQEHRLLNPRFSAPCYGTPCVRSLADD